MLFDVDWQGAHQLTEGAGEDIVSIFILPPSTAELERRLKIRGQDSDDVVAGRMARAADEISHWNEFDYVVANHDLDATVASVREAARAMKFQNVGSVLIIDQGRLEGIFTLQDLVYRVVAPGRDLDTTALGQVMTAKPDTIAADATALQALMSMQDGGYRHLPVMDGARVVAVVSRRDFFGSEKAQLEDQTYLWERI